MTPNFTENVTAVKSRIRLVPSYLRIREDEGRRIELSVSHVTESRGRGLCGRGLYVGVVCIG